MNDWVYILSPCSLCNLWKVKILQVVCLTCCISPWHAFRFRPSYKLMGGLVKIVAWVAWVQWGFLEELKVGRVLSSWDAIVKTWEKWFWVRHLFTHMSPPGEAKCLFWGPGDHRNQPLINVGKYNVLWISSDKRNSNIYMCWGLNSHLFPLLDDKNINPIQ